MLNFVENRTLVANIETESNFHLNCFMALLVEKGAFQYLADEVFGINPMNSKKKNFAINFKPEKAQENMKNLLAQYSQAKNLAKPN